jgi:ABC-2 type transport system permease protein
VVDVAAYTALVRASFRSQATYRLSLGLLLVASAGANISDFLVLLVIFTHLPRLGGWSLYEIGLVYGISGVGFGITDLAVGNLDKLPLLIRSGDFDGLLLRPLNSLFQVLVGEIGIRRLGAVLQSAGVLLLSLAHLNVHWTAPRVLVFAMSFVTGPLIFGSVWVIAMTHVFWTVDSGEAANAFTYGGRYLTSYPVNVFAGWLRDLLAFVIPLAFVAYYPVLLILGRPDPIGLPSWLPLLTPAIAAALPFAARAVWMQGVRHYRGTGT